MNGLIWPGALAIIALFISACGFHLRGAKDFSTGDSTFYVIHSNASEFADQLQQQLRLRKVSIVSSPEQADYIIYLSNENFIRDILSLNTKTGKVKEYILTLTVDMRITDGGEKVLMGDRSLEVSREFAFNEGTLLGQQNEEDILRKDMLQQGVSQAMKNIRAIIKSRDHQTQ